MPLRSVEAATRDDAIAAAREQFGPTARVVGVRRVRSGGVLGFFATERYVAEVASEQATRPDVPVPASGRAVGASAFVSSPLSAAAPATAAPSTGAGRARAAAPARNGAAAWAAAAGSVPPMRVPEPADDDRVAEFAGLLAGEPDEAPAPQYARASFPRATVQRTPSPSRRDTVRFEDDDDEWVEDWDDAAAPVAPAAVLPSALDSAAPSPFTAALARMVSADRDVRQAVQYVLDQPSTASATRPSGGTADQWPLRPAPLSNDTSAQPPAARQEEETVGDQVIAPPSPLADDDSELSNWAVEPEVAPGSSREEVIAEVLRSALAQGHSDEALAGILRKVLAGASPKTALTEPVAPRTEQDVVRPAAAASGLGWAPAEEAAPEPMPVPAPMSMAMALGLAMTRTEPPEPEPVRFAVPEPVVEVAPEAVAAPVHSAATFDVPPAEPATEQCPVVAETAPEAPATEVDWAEIPTSEVAVSEPAPVEYEATELPAVEYADEEFVADEQPFPEEASVDDESGDVAALQPTYPEPVRFSFPVRFPSSAEPLWGGTPAQVSLWGDVTAAVASAAADRPAPVVVETPIWADVEIPSPVIPTPATVAMPVVNSTMEAEDASETEVLATAEVLAELEVAADAEVEAEVEVAAEAEAEAEAVVVEAQMAEEAETAAEEADHAVLAPLLARTASDPAPLSLDATTVMPPLSLLPPLPGSRGSRGRPPVPPSSSRPSVPSSRPAAPAADTPPAAPATDAESPAPPSVPSSLATVTRLPVAPLMATPETPEMPGLFEELEEEFGKRARETAAARAPEPAVTVEPAPTVERPVTPPPATVPVPAGDVAARLGTLGVPAHLLGSSFAADVETYGAYAALTRSLGLRLPTPPELPSGPGEILFVVGPGVETLRAAQSLASSLRLDPDRVQWATRGDLAALAPRSSRMTTIDAAIDRRQEAAAAGTITIVAVDAPMRSDAYWMAQMLAIWTPVAVWAVVDATRKPDDLEPWLDGLDRVDALIVQDTDLSADPAAVLRGVAAPVAILDGVRATSHRWASLLCERLESGQA